MSQQVNNRARLRDFSPERELFLRDVVSGLRKSPKKLPSKYFYDHRGSQLYEEICSLGEYYIPRTEAAIMQRHVDEMVARLGPGVTLIEYGCGSCTKTRFLLDRLPDLAAYVPIDISREQLLKVVDELGRDYPALEILPVCADYTGDFALPAPRRRSDRIAVYYPGSTIGNFEPAPAREFLRHIAGVCRPGGALLIGVDLKKDENVLHAAYNDRDGVTAAFNLNLLERINRELEADFDTGQFEHRAVYNAREGRIEMHLVSRKEQVVRLDSVSIPFARGESIWTESSYKYDLEGFGKLAAAAGFSVDKVWTDERWWFSVQYLTCTG
ncbi:MAG: L-histidine N(alpha)-methyltransferase [Chloroflexota bacterium]